MRKLLISLGVAALAAGSLASCGDKGSSSASSEDKAFADTLATTLGEFAGAQQQSTFTRMKGSMSEEELAKSRIKYLTVAPMFAEAIERTYQEISIAKLFN